MTSIPQNRRILVVSTSTELDRATVELASRVARGLNGLIEFFHVFPLETTQGEGMLLAATDLSTGRDKAWLEKQRPTDSAIPFEHTFLVGDLEDEVVARAASHDVAMVILEQRSKSRWKNFFGASTAERLVRRLPCPLLVGGPQTFAHHPTPTPEMVPNDLRTKLDILNAVVDARSNALVNWMDGVARSAAWVAESDSLRSALWMGHVAKGQEGRAQTIINVELDEHRRALHARGWCLETPAARLAGGDVALPEGAAMDALRAQITEDGHATSLPLAVGGAVARLVVVAGAVVASGDRTGMLFFVFDAGDEFVRILEQPGPYPTLETYAFDRNGMMLSNSRFADHLHDAGLLDDGVHQTPLRLRVAEPGTGPRESWPLTHMAQHAVESGDGSDAAGYPDYRGKPVIGAWRWIESHRFGVVAEVDRAAD